MKRDKLTIYMDPEVILKLKLLAVKERVSVSDILEHCAIEYIKRADEYIKQAEQKLTKKGKR
jgi:hypothetical protein